MRRTTLQPIVALALAVLVSGPVAAAAPSANGEETLTGTLDAYFVEGFEDQDAAEQYELRTANGVVPVVFDDGGREGLGATKVRLTGRRVGRTLHVATSRPGPAFRLLETADGGGGAWAALDGSGGSAGGGAVTTGGVLSPTIAKSFAVILINFTNLATQPWSKSTVLASITGSPSSLKTFYEEESKGAMSVTGSVFGWYTIDAATTGCDWRTWGTLGMNAATAAGVDLSAFTNVMFIWPGTNECGFAGIAYVPGRYAYVNGTLSVQVITHEVGHNFGISHANARSCTISGSRVWLASDAACTTDVYADPFSTMGNNALRHNHGSQLGELGWLAASEQVVGAPGNTYTISPYLGSGPIKLVRIPRGDGLFFDLDIRTPYGVFDNFSTGSPATVGVTIRLGSGTASPTGTPKMTELLDTTPATTDLKDAPLLVGRTVKDPVSQISFTNLSSDSAGVTVRVKEWILPGAPGAATATATDIPSVDLSWGPAADNVGVASYSIRRDGAQVGSVPATATTWTDTGVTTGTAYTYQVAAVDTSGNTGPAVTATVTTPGAPPPTPSPTPSPTASPSPDPTPTPTPSPTPSPDPSPSPAPTDPPTDPDAEPPTAPDPLAGTPGITSVSLAWGPSTDNMGVAAYRVLRNGSIVATTSPGSTTWVDVARAPLTTYTYAVTALDTAGNSSQPVELAVTTKADTIRPSTPRNFRVVARSGGYVTFAWWRSTDNVRVARYALYREGRTRAVKYLTGLKVRVWARAGVRYYVRAIDTSGNRSYASRHVRGR